MPTFASRSVSGSGSLSLFGCSASVVYAVSDAGILYKSTDGGANFADIYHFPSAGFCNIHFIDLNTGYASSQRSIYKTTDGGVTWNRVARSGMSTIAEIHFTDANHGWAALDDGSVLVYKQ